MTVTKINIRYNRAWSNLIKKYGDSYTHLLIFSFNKESSSFYSSLMKLAELNINSDPEIIFKQIEWGDFYWYLVSIPNLILDKIKSIIDGRNLTLLQGVKIVTINDRDRNGNKIINLKVPFKNYKNVFVLATKSSPN